jgi:adenylate cyclase
LESRNRRRLVVPTSVAHTAPVGSETPGQDQPATTLLTADELASLAGTTTARVERLADHGFIGRTVDGRYRSGDVHGVRLLEAFETSGIPFQALVAGAASGRLEFGSYHELHRDPGSPSERTYGGFRAAVDPDGSALAALWVALGLAEPGPAARLTADEEAFLERWLGLLASVDDRDLGVRVVRLLAESARRTSDAALDVYTEAASRLGPDPVAVDPAAYAQLLEPWSHIARALPDLSAWLTERHLRRSIDAFSLETSERLLAAEGVVPERPVAPPGIAFVDLTGYTRVTQELGDEAAAAMSLRLGELARHEADARGGRLVKLLGDGALIHAPDARAAVATSLAVLDAIAAAGLGGGHVGIHRGPIIEREGDVYGRTVNLAARISDQAPDGAIYVTAEVVADLDGGPFACQPVGSVDLQGIGPVELFRVEAVDGAS